GRPPEPPAPPELPEPPARPRPGDASLLAGSWELELRGNAGLPFGSFLPRFGPLATARVTLAVAPERDSAGRLVPSPGELAGTFAFAGDPQPWLGARPAGDWAGALLEADGRVRLQLNPFPCSDCGNLMLDGRLRGGRVEGRWTREFASDGPGGAFTLRRIGR
ncbi:MAG TPA: hypothetical protein VKA84_11280, partial [Gemmatimonadaceae bacterium]|nr:hypothetical protein [Gemmatimonadaceae bacterium]